ncbi:MAG: dihydroorotate dehydrogenase [bacterium]|nr:dihydroorotate dehydrogenase [bacterium]
MSVDLVDIRVNLAGLELKNPVMVASGTFGYGQEYARFIDLNQLGAIVVKGVSAQPMAGNPPPRLVETPAGLLNSIGLQNVGLEVFIRDKLPFLQGIDSVVIVNILGHTVEEYVTLATELSKHPRVDALEINISCPNVERGGLAFGTDRQATFEVVQAVRQATHLPLITKLSPNVADIVPIARSAQDAGSDAVSLINTILGMAIDIHQRKPVLAKTVGGLSGPAIKPIALRMVWQVSQAVDIPVIGMGGIMSGDDAIEFLLAGASAVSIGTALFVDPQAPIKVLKGIEEYMKRYRFHSIREIVGQLDIG